MKIKVTPFHKRGYSAPYRVIDMEDREKNPMEKAVNIAKPLSRLSDFDCWSFYPELI